MSESDRIAFVINRDGLPQAKEWSYRVIGAYAKALNDKKYKVYWCRYEKSILELMRFAINE